LNEFIRVNFLRDLRVLRGEKLFSEKSVSICTEIRQHHACSRGFCFAQRAQRAQRKNRKEGGPCSPSPRPLRLCAHLFLPAGFWFGPARRARPWDVALGRRFFEQEKTERTERHWTWSLSPFPLLPPVRISSLSSVPALRTSNEFLHGTPGLAALPPHAFKAQMSMAPYLSSQVVYIAPTTPGTDAVFCSHWAMPEPSSSLS